jgi:hypothetical protein
VPLAPNAGAHLLPEAGATQERTLEAVRCGAWLGADSATDRRAPPRAGHYTAHGLRPDGLGASALACPRCEARQLAHDRDQRRDIQVAPSTGQCREQVAVGDICQWQRSSDLLGQLPHVSHVFEP